MTTAADEELRLLAVYAMRDTLMKRYGYTELLATETAMLLLETLSKLSDEELIEVKRRVNRLKRTARDNAIRAELRTGNAAEVGRKHGLSERRVYKIAAQRTGA
jgi:hypothetical protein